MSDGDFPMPGEVGEQFLCLARYPKNIGWLDNLNRKGAAVGKCGDSIEVSRRVDMGTIADIKVLPHGCVNTLVCASALGELAKGLDWDHALELEPHDVADARGGLPEDRRHCARLAANTPGEAMADYYRRASPSGSGGSV